MRAAVPMIVLASAIASCSRSAPPPEPAPARTQSDTSRVPRVAPAAAPPASVPVAAAAPVPTHGSFAALGPELHPQVAGAWLDSSHRPGFFVAGTSTSRVWLVTVDHSGQAHTTELGRGRVHAALFVRDEIWVSVEATSESSFSRTPQVLRVGPDGIRSRTNLAPEVSGEVNALAAVADGVVGAGVHNPITSGVTNGWVLRFRSDGSLAWERRPGDGAYHYMAAVAVLDDTVFALGGAKNSTYDEWCVRFRGDGTPRGELVVPAPTWEGTSGGAVTLPGHVIGTGIRATEQGSMRSCGEWVVDAFDASGRHAWARHGGEHVCGVSAPIAVADAGVAFVAAHLETERGTTGHLELVWIDAAAPRPVRAAVPAQSVMLDFATVAAFPIAATATSVRLLTLHAPPGATECAWAIVELDRAAASAPN